MKAKIIMGIIVVAVLIVGGIYILVYRGNNQQTINQGNQQDISNSQIKNIEISDFAFSPATLTIKAGDTVVWTNKDNAQHTVTGDSGNELSSDMLAKGEAYAHTFNTTGAYNYHCIPHQFMKARITVE